MILVMRHRERRRSHSRRESLRHIDGRNRPHHHEGLWCTSCPAHGDTPHDERCWYGLTIAGLAWNFGLVASASTSFTVPVGANPGVSAVIPQTNELVVMNGRLTVSGIEAHRVLSHGAFSLQIGVDLRSPASWPALQYVGVMQ